MWVVILQGLFGVALLLVATLWPRDGQPVVFLTTDERMSVRLLLAEDWRMARIADFGPIKLIVSHPESERARLRTLFSASGTNLPLAIRAFPPRSCDNTRLPGRTS